MENVVTGCLYHVQPASLWEGLPFCTVVLYVESGVKGVMSYAVFLLAFGRVALELQTYALPCQVKVAFRQLPLSVEDEKQYRLYDGLYQIEAVLHSS